MAILKKISEKSFGLLRNKDSAPLGAKKIADIIDQSVFIKSVLLFLTLASSTIVVSLFIFETDENVELRGETVSGSGNQVLRAYNKAVVEEIKVGDGDFVKQGQIVMRLVDPSLKTRLLDSNQSISKLQAQLRNSIKSCSLNEVSLANRLRILNEIKQQKDKSYRRISELQKVGAVSQMQVDGLAAEVLDARNTIFVLNQEIEQNNNSCREKQSDLDLQIDKQKQERSLVMHEIKNMDIKAPMQGYVYDLASVSVGTTVEPGERIASFVPDSNLRVRVSVPSKEIALLKTGQVVDLRYDAYPFTKYGSMSGKITSIAPQRKFSSELDNLTQSNNAGIGGRSSSDRTGEFTVVITPKSQELVSENKIYRIGPGLSVSVLAKLRSRKLIEYATTAFRLFYEPITTVR